MKLWVDDIRKPPPGWLWAMNSAAAIEILGGVHGDKIDEISLDHDLGEEDTTRPVVMWMVENERWPASIRVHDANLGEPLQTYVV